MGRKKAFSYDPNNKARGKGRKRGKIQTDADATELTGSVTWYAPPTVPEGHQLLVIDGHTMGRTTSANATPQFIILPTSSTELIDVVNRIPGIGANATTEAEAYAALASSNDCYISSPSDGNVSTDKLVLELDASKKISYPGTGTTWYDLSGQNNNATLKASSQFNSEGYFQYGGNGVDDESSVSTVEVNTNSSEGNTVEQWIWSDERDGNGNMPFTWWNQSWDLWAYGNHFGINNGSSLVYGITNSDDVLIGKWNHVVTYFPNNWSTSYQDAKMWINGVSQSLSIRQGSLASRSLSASQTVGVGGGYTSGGNNFNWDGRVATTRIYAKELSHSEVLQNYYEAPNIPSGAKIIIDSNHPISVNSSGLQFDLAQQYDNLNTWGYSDSDLGTDFDGMTEFTYCLWLHCYSHHTSYSQSPFNKYAGTSTAVVRLYDFGDYNGNGDNGKLRFYMNRGGTWSHVGNTHTMAVGETAFVALQFNSTDSGQMWVNGQKQGTRSGGTGAIATNTAAFNIVTPEYGGEQYTKVKAAYVYNRELTDQEITDLYTSTQTKHGL